MASQGATALLRDHPRADGRREVRLRLSCGCEVDLVVTADRVQTSVDGERFAVGKYPCPQGHPVAPSGR
jgi:hypothetical protein